MEKVFGSNIVGLDIDKVRIEMFQIKFLNSLVQVGLNLS